MYPSFDALLLRVIEDQKINLVWDIGANEGQFVQMLREAGFKGKIISCEPLSQAFADLEKAAAQDPLWTTLKVAVGDVRGTAKLQIAGNSVSSSLRPMKDRHVEAAPKSRIVGSEDCEVWPLQDLWELHCSSEDRALLKIDTQGYESQVLTGAEKIFPKLFGILLEMSFVELYEGQTTFIAQYEYLLRHGYYPVAIQPVFLNRKTLELLQSDFLFKRRQEA